ncbi:TrmH family RNA methyltransferase [Flavobacterium selenitireducens]|uniref:TrmH family RNA methyltransferase n=1 Tax=Flavobacterium selenitireducens TaxID=2722704 RepID=UPI00168AE652|nr:RNA methyltransferase [Flavobacterium selenitireducens]MBD3581529.1 RNA methyltransferase [Flavobacterium selenitireducens]
MIDTELLYFLESILTEERKARFLQVLSRRTNHFTVAMEDIFQLHNTSAVMRSCEVFGIQQLNVVEEKYGKSIDKEIAMGAEKWVDINRFASIQDCIGNLKEKGYKIVATTPHSEDCTLDEFDVSQKSALFFGTERNGLSQQVIDQADGFLKIPMEGFTESLNISVSAAIILQNLTSRLRNADVDWKLSETEILEKRLDWARKSIKDIERIESRFIETKSQQ